MTSILHSWIALGVILFLINALWVPILFLGSYFADFWEYVFDKESFKGIIVSK